MQRCYCRGAPKDKWCSVTLKYTKQVVLRYQVKCAQWLGHIVLAQSWKKNAGKSFKKGESGALVFFSIMVLDWFVAEVSLCVTGGELRRPWSNVGLKHRHERKVLLFRSLVIMYFEQSYHLQLESAPCFRDCWKAQVNRWCICDTIR